MRRFSKFIRESIPIEQEAWDTYVQDQGNQRLYHIVGGLGEHYWQDDAPDYPKQMAKLLDILEDIQEENGLLPASAEIRNIDYGDISSRDGFAYLATDRGLASLGPGGKPEYAPIYVNSIDLDPNLIYPDEDHVVNNIERANREYGHDFYRPHMEDSEYGYFGNLAEFVEKLNQAGFDVDNTMALHSLDRGGLLAYEGGVPPSIIRPNEIFWKKIREQYDETLKANGIDYHLKVDGIAKRSPQWRSWLFQTEEILERCAQLSDPESSGEFQAMIDDINQVYGQTYGGGQ